MSDETTPGRARLPEETLAQIASQPEETLRPDAFAATAAFFRNDANRRFTLACCVLGER